MRREKERKLCHINEDYYGNALREETTDFRTTTTTIWAPFDPKVCHRMSRPQCCARKPKATRSLRRDHDPSATGALTVDTADAVLVDAAQRRLTEYRLGSTRHTKFSAN